MDPDPLRGHTSCNARDSEAERRAQTVISSRRGLGGGASSTSQRGGGGLGGAGWRGRVGSAPPIARASWPRSIRSAGRRSGGRG